jgi:hypothetical protein
LSEERLTRIENKLDKIVDAIAGIPVLRERSEDHAKKIEQLFVFHNTREKSCQAHDRDMAKHEFSISKIEEDIDGLAKIVRSNAESLSAMINQLKGGNRVITGAFLVSTTALMAVGAVGYKIWS